MSRYRSYGQLDDQFVVEGDTFFSRMNARLRSTQLQEGEVALSENGRMSEDGTWQPRKGLQTLSGAITLDSAATRLPYRVAGGQRSNGVVTLILQDTPSIAFQPGDDVTVVGVNAATDSPNGTFVANEVFYSNKQIQYTQAGADESFTTDVDSIIAPESNIPTQLDFTLSDVAANEVFGSCVYSDPESTFTDDYIFTATNNVMQILRLRDRVEYKVRYPAGESIVARCYLMQAYNRVYVFRGTDTTLECTPTLTTFTIASAVRNNNTITVTTSANHNLVQDQFITLVGLGDYAVGGNPNGVYQVEANNLTATSFEVTFATADTGTETYIASGSRVEHFNDFTLVANGQYTLPDHIIDLAVISGTGNFVGGVSTNPEGQDGQITINETNHGLEVSQSLTIVDAGSPIDLYIGKEVKVSQVIDADHFTIPLAVGAIPFSSNVILKLAKKNPISFLRHMPAAPFAIQSQRRMWMPYFYEEDYDVTPFSWTARAGKDEIIASDILDPDTYDVIGGQFKVTGGSNDFVVGLKAFTEDRILVLCRRSIQQLTGASGSLNDVRIDNVTNDLGCAARDTIVQIGNQVLFLSDKGVFSLQFIDEYNLRGNEIPLSDPIQPYIDRINQRFINRSVAAYFDNRYWIAVPLDSSPENNYIFVYNFLNKGWESIDRVDSLQFNIRDMLIGREGEENRLYITTSEGGVHKVDGFDGGDQVSVTAGVSVSETIPVESRVITREYDCDTLDRKVFSRSEVHLKSQPDSTSDANIVYETTDPDRSQSAQAVSTLLSTTLAQGEDASIRSRIRLRGYGCSVNITPTQGRPYVRAVKVEGRITDRSTTSTT
jgi:hypothetical protein